MDCILVPRTSVNQSPFGGSVYPFTQPGDFCCVLLDLHLSYLDDLCPQPPTPNIKGQPQEPAKGGYRPSFYISTMTGFSSTEADVWENIAIDWENWSSAWETGGLGILPANMRLVIEDEDAQVVFDTDNLTPRFRTWGPDRVIVMWSDSDQGVLKIVVRLLEGPSNVSERLEIDPRTYSRVPGRLSTLQGNTGPVELVAGYNMRIDVEPISVADGKRRQTRIVFNAIPGAGLGRFSDCGEERSPIRRIGGREAGSDGNFLLDADGCFRIQRPVSIFEEDDVGRIAVYGDTGIGEADAKHALRIDSDCAPLCPDSYYIRVHRGMLRMWDRWKTLAEDLEAVRDDYRTVKARWDAQRACRLANPIRLVVAAEKGCKFTIGGLFCNMSGVCLANTEIRFKLTLRDRDAVDLATGSPCSQAVIQSSFTKGQEYYDMGGTWPQYFASFPYINSQDTSSVRFRVCVPGCTSTKSLQVEMTVHGPDVEGSENYPIIDPDGSLYGSDYPLRYATSQTVPFNTSPPAYGCEC
jgi:hypothetical protein